MVDVYVMVCPGITFRDETTIFLILTIHLILFVGYQLVPDAPIVIKNE